MSLNAPFLILNARRTRQIVLLPAVVCVLEGSSSYHFLVSPAED